MTLHIFSIKRRAPSKRRVYEIEFYINQPPAFIHDRMMSFLFYLELWLDIKFALSKLSRDDVRFIVTVHVVSFPFSDVFC